MRIGILALLWAGLATAAPHHSPPEKVILAPGYAELTFTPPLVGSYSLPVLGDAADGEVVNEASESVRLHQLLGDKFVLFSFIYTNCSDVNGCPLASYVLSKVQDAVRGDDRLSDYVRLISLSFDRSNDTPEVLARYAGNFRKEDFDWQFLTTSSDTRLNSILRDYDQFIIEDVNESGKKVGSISHILRVYLIDQHRRIRNIYSVSFLHPDIIINDILTIVKASGRQK